MAAGLTYTPITSSSLSGTSSFTFSSIASSYTDLVLVVTGSVASGPQNINMRLNSDSGTNYSRTFMSGSAAQGASSSNESSYSYITLDRYGYPGTYQSPATYVIHFNNYSNTTTYKTILSRSNNANYGTGAVVGLWRSTAAISTIYCYLTGSTFSADATATLYGITAA